jgi:hypothetical protein
VPPGAEVPTPLSAGRYHSFVVRVFSRGAGSGVVHAQITHIASRSTLHLRDLQGIVGFIRAHMDRRPLDPDLTEREIATYGDG